MAISLAMRGWRRLSTMRVGVGIRPAAPAALELRRIAAQCDVLAALAPPPSAAHIAEQVIAAYRAMAPAARVAFFKLLADRYGPDLARLDAAVTAYGASPDASTIAELHLASEPRRQQLIRRLNLAADGTAALVALRREMIELRADIPGFDAMDADFLHVLSSWFNGGFLTLKRLEWSAPASLLRKLIEYEAVHQIAGWDDLRGRLEPQDRRCYAFFHPRLPDEPLIFVEVALTQTTPGAIEEILGEGRTKTSAEGASVAVFYSISNCQAGLRGVPFGNFLIKQVVEVLKSELPNLKTFVTLSPAPGFKAWACGPGRQLPGIGEHDRAALALLGDERWVGAPETLQALSRLLPRLAAWYYLHARTRRGELADPVARFHLANGARLERIHILADRSARGLQSGAGVMVNYWYDLREIDRNNAAFARGEVVASSGVHRLARALQRSDHKADADPVQTT